MSSDANSSPYSGDAGQPPQYHQQPPPQAYQPPPPQGAYEPQPYVEPGSPSGAGGQPPYLPPGAYVPSPMPPAGRGRGPNIAIAAILSVVLLAAVGAVVLFKFILVSGPDPAESLPSSASMYMEVNLDPSFDQTPKLLDHLGKFEDLDYDSTDDMLADLLEESGLEGVDAEEDLSSWLGTRHGLAMWEHDDQPYAVISLASTDANAAEDGLATIRTAAGAEEDQMAYTVEDDHVLMVVGETGAAAALDAAESEAGSEPLAASQSYEDARAWLDGDQLVTYWVDMDAVAEFEELAGDDEAEAFLDFYSGQMILGLSAFDDGFEVNYRLFNGQDDPWSGSEDLMASMGGLPASDFAATAYVPENLPDVVNEWTTLFEDFYGDEEAAAEPAVAEPLTDAEYAEYLELSDGYYGGTLSVEDEARYMELDERYWTYGTEDEPAGYPDDTDYGPDFAEIEAQINEAADLLAGSSLAFAGNFDAEQDVDPDSLFFSAHLAEDRAQELEDMIDEWSDDAALPEGAEADGSEFSYTGSAVASEPLSDDDRFSDFADVAPSSTALAVWFDLAAAAEAHPDDFEGAEPLSALAWAHGSEDGDGTGVVRLYLKD
ncbi:hypothetical protein K3N28_07545 [Glycomyces sp. TRM65418]|uniref:hypothetical protein n=1 Tax=Glycomyces sp. TRM65418 TaxID=2867006 RepID=UPI001CE6A0FD|nr:hypothetical protein [Glycomyces sp. TRM65418]MCC3762924.1 hypothetical protein [Glycomyces sp. TRM65418]QZD56949.1 hypothetical protein K3N28_07495 [Glycomyces sp. TRM65418]